MQFACFTRGALAMRVCVCVCVSVCLTHAGIISKGLNVESRKQRHVIAQGLIVF